MMRFKRKGKLAAKYIRIYEIIKQVSKVPYRFIVLTSIDHIHDMFYVLFLPSIFSDLSRVLKTKEIQLSKDLSYN